MRRRAKNAPQMPVHGRNANRSYRALQVLRVPGLSPCKILSLIDRYNTARLFAVQTYSLRGADTEDSWRFGRMYYCAVRQWSWKIDVVPTLLIQNRVAAPGCRNRECVGPYCNRSEEHTSELQSLRHLVC